MNVEFGLSAFAFTDCAQAVLICMCTEQRSDSLAVLSTELRPGTVYM